MIIALVGIISRYDGNVSRYNRYIIGHAIVGIISGNLLLGYMGLTRI